MGGLCSVCIEGSKPSVTAEFSYGPSVISGLSRPKIDCRAQLMSARGCRGGARGLPMHFGSRVRALSRLLVC